jgi:hypothetical protein
MPCDCEMQRFKMPWLGVQFPAKNASIVHFFFLKTLVNKLLKLHKKSPANARLLLSGWQDSNLRPPRPKRGAMTGLRYTPKV